MKCEAPNEALDYIIRRRGLPIPELADAAGVTRRRLNALRCTPSWPTEAEAEAIAKALELPVSNLWDEYALTVDHPQPPAIDRNAHHVPKGGKERLRPMSALDARIAGRRFQKLLKEGGLTYKAFEGVIQGSVNVSSIRRLAIGEWVKPSAEVLRVICNGLSRTLGRKITPGHLGWGHAVLPERRKGAPKTATVELGAPNQ